VTKLKAVGGCSSHLQGAGDIMVAAQLVKYVTRSYLPYYMKVGHKPYPPFSLAASVSWCWSWENEGRAVEVIPVIPGI